MTAAVPPTEERFSLRNMLADASAWARANYPGVAFGRYKDAAYEIDRLRKKVARLSPEPEGWQPIETAPKDGTEIFVLREDWGTAPLAHWGEYPGGMVLNSKGQDVDMDGWLLDESFSAGHEDGFLGWDDDPMPTHWMPCLSPTKSGGQS